MDFGDVVKIILIVGLTIVLCALPIMLLWNWLMPIIFGLPTISFWQALGLNLLTGLLFRTSNVKVNKD